MANTIKIKQSSVSGKVPLAGDLEQGELAINTLDEKLYTKNSSGSVVQLGGAYQNNVAATAAPTVDEDSDEGYEVGSIWIDVTNDLAYTCVDATVGAAVWTQGGGGSGFTSATTAPVDPTDGDHWFNTTSGILNIRLDGAWLDISTAGAGMADIVEDTTPQLGGDLDLNSSDITGTGNMSVTGDVQVDGKFEVIGQGSTSTPDLQVGSYNGVGVVMDFNTLGRIYADSSFLIQGASASKTSAKFDPDGEVALRFDSSEKFATTTGGVEITGDIVVSGTVDGRDIDTDGTKLDTIETSADVTDTTNVVAALTAGTNVAISAGGTISSTDTVYTHPTGNGNNHIPTDGSADQLLTYSAAGTAVWADAPGGGLTSSASAPSSPDDGDHWFDTTNGILNIRLSGAWLDISTAGAGMADIVEDTTPQLGGNLDTQSFTVDGRDVSTDGTKLDGIEASADVTDATNVAAAGAVMNTGNETVAGDKTFSGDTELTGIKETLTSKSASFTPNLVTEGTVYEVSGTLTLTVPTAEAGRSFTVMDDGTGTLSWGGTIKWSLGTVPTASGICIYTFISNGTDWYGMQSGSAFA